ncbi:MAG: small subunit ribosomal protein S11 [Parcubacteria group bacterium Gr01-1014_2]|nr:MAG: small subunit ribosomal protein S11 [Parcubacteria group bacterium Gr01-1014_2]
MGKKKIVTKSGDETSAVDKEAKVKVSKKASKRQVIKGNIYIHVSFNNTIVTVTDEKGGVLSWASAGNLGFKGTRKSTPFAATLVGKSAAEKARRFGFAEADIFVKGVGPGRDAAIRGLFSAGVDIRSIIDNTPIPHGGVKAPKPRRV